MGQRESTTNEQLSLQDLKRDLLKQKAETEERLKQLTELIREIEEQSAELNKNKPARREFPNVEYHGYDSSVSTSKTDR
jgi:hypothetical protein